MNKRTAAVWVCFFLSLFFFAYCLLSPSSGACQIREALGPSLFDPLFGTLTGLLLIAAFFATESPRLRASKEISVVSMIIALGSAGRILFVALPNVSPVDWLTLCSGIVFGPTTGFTVGAGIMMVSNFWLGQGPWTISQMVGMGMLGLVGGVVGRVPGLRRRHALAAIGFIWGPVYGTVTTFFWMLYVSSVSWVSFAGLWASGLPFYLLQGVGNLVLLWILGERTVGIFQRVRLRLLAGFGEARTGASPVESG